MIEVEVKESFPPNSNPFLHDAYHMGTKLGSNVMILYKEFTDEKQKYIYLVNIETGERIKIKFE